jgi:hypothetical protein
VSQTPAERLERVLGSEEDEHLECKEAKNRFDFEELVKYCVALAMSGAGPSLSESRTTFPVTSLERTHSRISSERRLV